MAAAVSLVILLVALTGCSRGPAIGTVKGTITLDGQPVDGGLIRLVPADGNSPNPMQIWWAQVNYWITSDVAAAIRDLNANSTSVMDSPVKNLISLTIPEDFFPPIGQAQAAAPEDQAGATPATGGIPDPTLAIPDASGVSST